MDYMYKEKNMEKVNLHGLTEVLIMENLLRTISKVRESIYGLMDVNMMENGKTIKWKIMEYLPGMTVEGMKGPT